MAGEFLQFNPDQNNQLSDVDYSNSPYRQNGITSGIAPGSLHNKLFYQLTTMVKALADVLAGKGATISDANLAILTSNSRLALNSSPVLITEGNTTYTYEDMNKIILIYGDEPLTIVIPPATGAGFFSGTFFRFINIGSSVALITGGGYSIYIYPGEEITLIPYSPLGTSGWYGTRISSAISTLGAYVDLTTDLSIRPTSTSAIAITGSAKVLDIINSLNLSVSLNSSGAGGLDRGTKVVSAWYYVWLIFNDVLTLQNAIFSLSASAPTMPSGYTKKVLIGAVQTDSGGNLLSFKQKNRDVSLTAESQYCVLLNGHAGSLTQLDLSAAVPPNAKSVRGKILFEVYTSSESLYLSPASGYETQQWSVPASTSVFIHSFPFDLPLLEAQKMYYQISAANANTRVSIYVRGYGF